MMPPYAVRCYTPDCGELAAYKIAARWSNGTTEELKTYALSCERCLADWYRRSCQKRAACRLTSGETLERPGIYGWERGRRDRELQRLRGREDELANAEPPK